MQLISYLKPARELTSDDMRKYINDLKFDIKSYRESALHLFDYATGLYLSHHLHKITDYNRTQVDEQRLINTLRNIIVQTRLRAAELSVYRPIDLPTSKAWLINEEEDYKLRQSLISHHVKTIHLKPTAISFI